MSIIDRYTSAVRSSNLKSKPETTHSDTDVLGAMGLAGKRNPLAAALARLFAGDNTAAHEVVEILARSVKGKAKHDARWLSLAGEEADGAPLTWDQSVEIARSVLAWFRDGTCKSCGGHGFRVIDGALGEGRTVVGGVKCKVCRGTGKVPFDKHFPIERLGLARWLLAEVEREQGVAGQAAMAMLAPKLDL